MKIIHINGVSGSGKSTLARLISKNKKFYVIDTDDIDDKNALKIINNNKYDNLFTDKNMGKFFRLKDKMNDMDMKDIVEKAKINNKILVVVGLTINVPNANYKYLIKTNPVLNYKRLNMRTIDDLCKNYNNIKKLLNSKKSIHKIAMLLLHKYKIRLPMPQDPPEFERRIKAFEKRGKKDKFIILDADNIYRKVISLSK